MPPVIAGEIVRLGNPLTIWRNQRRGPVTLASCKTGGQRMRRAEHSVVINRPPEEVFAFITNPRNDPLWNAAFIATEQTSIGPFGVGTTLRATGKFLGQHIEALLEVTEYEPDHRSCVKAISGPVRVEACRIVEPIEGGTRVTETVAGEVGRVFSVAEPVVERAGQRQLETDLAVLKDVLESRPPGEGACTAGHWTAQRVRKA
jgi:hypothetical protein